MAQRGRTIFTRVIGALAFAGALALPFSAASADDIGNVESAFDRTFGTELRGPRTYDSPLEAQIAALASADQGRIGVAAIDLSSGRTIHILGEQPFPLASTSKIAIAATYLDGVEKGRWKLNDKYPLMLPVPSRKFDGPIAPVRPGERLTALSLIELALTRSDNPATDALLAAVGGPDAVNAWLRRAGIEDVRIDRDIATLVRDDGAVDPAKTVDPRDSATPLAMVRLLAGLHQGEWLSERSRAVLLGAMSRCVTGKRRIPAKLPQDVRVAHKTGSLYNTSSDVGFIEGPDGRTIAVAIYVTGQGTRLNREARIATLARAIYDGYQARPVRTAHNAAR